MTQPNPEEQRITAALATILRERGVSQMDVERLLANTDQPIKQPSLSQAFSGQRSLSLSEFAAITSAVGIKMSEVLDRTVPP